MKYIASIEDLRVRAKRRLPKSVFDFLDGAAGDEITLRKNQTDFQNYFFKPRVAVDVSDTNFETQILGKTLSRPFGFSPIGFAGLFHPHGEVIAARVAAKHNIPFCLSTNSVKPLEDIIKAAPKGDNWFQLYMLKDRDWTYKLIKRAQDAGYRVLCLTLDLPVAGRRERDVRNGFQVPLRVKLSSIPDYAIHLPWILQMMTDPVRFGNFEGNPHATGFASIAEHVSKMFDPSVTWDDVKKVRDLWKGPLLLKGILHPEDAQNAMNIGAEAISVSNHGGRQLDGAVSALDALPDIHAAVGNKLEVLLDSGIRRGVDILKAKALGASAVLVGRGYIYGLAAAGEKGIEKAVELLSSEMTNAMTLMGVDDINQLSNNHIVKRAH